MGDKNNFINTVLDSIIIYRRPLSKNTLSNMKDYVSKRRGLKHLLATHLFSGPEKYLKITVYNFIKFNA